MVCKAGSRKICYTAADKQSKFAVVHCDGLLVFKVQQIEKHMLWRELQALILHTRFSRVNLGLHLDEPAQLEYPR
jgi:hypothetical protein